jgi:outer membrane protein OmpA-like peptidoglycan-associated protein
MLFSRLAAAGLCVAITAAPVLAQPELAQLRNDRSRLDSIGAAYKRLRDSVASRTASCPCPAPASDAARVSALIHFDFDRSDITPEGRATLDRTMPVFRANPGQPLQIVGHGDERASDASTLALGKRRSLAARRYLIAHGIEERRISFISTTERSHSRRDELEIVMPGENSRRP